MISLLKLKKLEINLRCRKVLRILYEYLALKNYDKEYVREAIKLCCEKDERLRLYKIDNDQDFYDIELLLRKIVGEEQYDWDFLKKEDSRIKKDLKCAIYLDRIRSPFNVGSILRTANAFSIKKIYLHPLSPDLKNKRLLRVAMNSIEDLDVEICDEDELLAKNKRLFALELNGEDINNFHFQEDSIMVIGSEEFGVCSKLLKACDEDLGRASIALDGKKASLNVSSAFSIAAFSWISYLS